MQGIGRDQTAVASLQQRIAEMEQTNGELLAFARGHAGAANAIHEAVLALMEVPDMQTFANVVTREWPALLGVEAAALAWSADGKAIAADINGLRAVEPRLVVRMSGMERPITVREVDRGHPLLGKAAADIRAEIVIRLSGARGIGLIILGERQVMDIDTPAATRLLRFLGRAASVMLERWSLS